MTTDNVTYNGVEESVQQGFRDLFRKRLQAETARVEFSKADGTRRVMNCTLNEAVLPPAKKDDPLTQKKVRAINEDAQVVWDIDKKAWRSFRWDRLKRIDFDNS